MIRPRKMRVAQQPPVVLSLGREPTLETLADAKRYFRRFGRRLVVLGPGSSLDWPLPASQRHGRHARELRVVHELRQETAPEPSLRAVGER